MKIFTLLLPEQKNTICGFAVAFLVVLSATAALGDEIDGSLPPDSPPTVKASARQAIQSGLEKESVVKLTRAMLQNKFNEQQVKLVHSLMIEAKNSDMPVQLLMNKAFEGMAKNVDPSRIVGAMETVQSRNAFAYQHAVRLSKNKSQTANLGRALSDSLAAGFSKEDADKVTKRLQQRAKLMKSDKAYSLALECFKTSRDVSRLGVTSKALTNLLVVALKKGFDHQEMHAMRSAFMTKAHQSQPQNLARSYSAAIQEGKGFQGDPGGGAGEGSDGMGPGASGSEGSGSGGSGGSGSSGGGSSGSGSGGPGPGSN
ncbi:MAG: hypothetical protein JRE29_01135 [Deltaproteobacteria bacterium]|nr:hypothetical protein [Deltaproteobacteria bacterium]